MNKKIGSLIEDALTNMTNESGSAVEDYRKLLDNETLVTEIKKILENPSSDPVTAEQIKEMLNDVYENAYDNYHYYTFYYPYQYAVGKDYKYHEDETLHYAFWKEKFGRKLGKELFNEFEEKFHLTPSAELEVSYQQCFKNTNLSLEISGFIEDVIDERDVPNFKINDENDLEFERNFYSPTKPVIDVCDEIISASDAIAMSDFLYAESELEEYLKEHPLPLSEDQCLELKQNIKDVWHEKNCWAHIDIDVLENDETGESNLMKFHFSTASYANSIDLTFDANTGLGNIGYTTYSHNYLDKNSGIVSAFKDTSWRYDTCPEKEMLKEQIYLRSDFVSNKEDILHFSFPKYSVDWDGSEEFGLCTMAAVIHVDRKNEVLQFVALHPDSANEVIDLCNQKLKEYENIFIPSDDQIDWLEQGDKYDHEYYQNALNEVMSNLKNIKTECEHMLQDPFYCPKGVTKLMSLEDLEQLREKVSEISAMQEYSSSKNADSGILDAMISSTEDEQTRLNIIQNPKTNSATLRRFVREDPEFYQKHKDVFPEGFEVKPSEVGDSGDAPSGR